MRVATSAAVLPRRSTAFVHLTPHEKYDRLRAVYPTQAAAIVKLMDYAWERLESQRKRQARADLKVSAGARGARSTAAR